MGLVPEPDAVAEAFVVEEAGNRFEVAAVLLMRQSKLQFFLYYPVPCRPKTRGWMRNQKRPALVAPTAIEPSFHRLTAGTP
jgi:hypothetical protein